MNEETVNNLLFEKKTRSNLIPEIEQKIICLLFPIGFDLLALSKIIFYNIFRLSTFLEFNKKHDDL